MGRDIEILALANQILEGKEAATPILIGCQAIHGKYGIAILTENNPNPQTYAPVIVTKNDTNLTKEQINMMAHRICEAMNKERKTNIAPVAVEFIKLD